MTQSRASLLSGFDQFLAAGGFRSYLAGLTLSTAGSSSSFGIAAGVAMDSTNTDLMALTSAFTKTTGTWAAGSGNGAVASGSLAGSTWYHVYLIMNPTSGAVDIFCDTNANGTANLPSGYTLFRRIGSIKTDGSNNWVGFTQNGDEFLWNTPVQDVNGVTIGTTALTPTLTVPPGVKVWALVDTSFISTSAVGAGLNLNSPDVPAAAIGLNRSIVSFSTSVGNGLSVPPIRTNTSAQIRATADTASCTYYINTQGWIDRRGRDN